MVPTFDQRVALRAADMSPAERRVVRYFQGNREEVLISSAAALAVKAQTSDATVVRATRALGFSGLDELRRALADEFRNSLSPAERLSRTLDEVGDDLFAAFLMALEIHAGSLESLRRSISPELFEKAVDAVAGAPRVLVFGLGPSSAIADYLVIQLGRFGLIAEALSNTGLLFADDLRRLREGDLIVILAYGRVYAELAALLDEIARLRLRSFLITDSLADTLRCRVDFAFTRAARAGGDAQHAHGHARLYRGVACWCGDETPGTDTRQSAGAQRSARETGRRSSEISYSPVASLATVDPTHGGI